MRRLSRLIAEKSIFFNCDIQQHFIQKIHGFESVHHAASSMAYASQFFQIPCLVTEQNSKVFGHTVTDIIERMPANLHQTFEKTSFSMVNDETKVYLEANKTRKQAILYGIEAQVCVYQTCLDLLELDYEVHILLDGTSSISPIDRKAGIQRMQAAGAYPASSQQIIFEYLKDYKNPLFKQMLPYLKHPKNEWLLD